MGVANKSGVCQHNDPNIKDPDVVRIFGVCMQNDRVEISQITFPPLPAEANVRDGSATANSTFGDPGSPPLFFLSPS